MPPSDRRRITVSYLYIGNPQLTVRNRKHRFRLQSKEKIQQG